MQSLSSKIVVVTGASRGIGRSIALRLARSGARLAICARDEKALAETAVAAVEASGEPVLARPLNLTDEDSLLDFYAAVRQTYGPPDVLVNNAGSNERKAPIVEIETDEFDRALSLNLRAPFLLAREALRDMIPRKSGHIVQILSTVCHFANEAMGIYTAAKRGLEGLTDVLRKEARPHGIRVSAIYPGGTNTTFRAAERPDYMRPESVAEAVHAVLTLPEDLIVHQVTFRPMVETNY